MIFNTIPEDYRVPGSYAEFDSSRATSGLLKPPNRLLVMGQRTSSGAIAEKVITRTDSGEAGANYFGKGSMLALMIKAIKDNGKNIDCFAVALNDAVSSVAATGTIAFSGTATENGILNVYIGGRRVRVRVLTADSADAVAGNLEDAINADLNLPVTASATTSTVTLTAKNKGVNGNYLDIRLNYYGLQGGEKTPAGISATITAMASGAGNPSVADIINILPEIVYDVIVMPWDDTTNLGLLETELADRQAGIRMLEGFAIIAKRETLANLITFSSARNGKYVSCFPYANSPTTPHEAAAMVASRVAFEMSQDPARPLTGLPLNGFLAPPEASRFSADERNSLLHNGLSTFTVDRTGQVQIERLVTMYQTIGVDTPDPSYLDITTPFTNSYVRQDWIAYSRKRFQRMKIANDGTRLPAGSNTTTPNLIRADMIGRAQLWENRGLIEDLDQFIADLVVERAQSDPTRVNWQAAPNLQNPLYVLAGQFQFIV